MPYLSREAIGATLSVVAAHPGGAELVFDYGENRDTVDPALRTQFEERAARVAAAGEPFVSFFEPAELCGWLEALGFDRVEDLDVPVMIVRVLGERDGVAESRASGVCWAELEIGPSSSRKKAESFFSCWRGLV